MFFVPKASKKKLFGFFPKSSLLATVINIESIKQEEKYTAMSVIVAAIEMEVRSRSVLALTLSSSFLTPGPSP